uniref:AlNc14C163G7811 protein n=1 Tax=Albugo laibachii Nc14 TaxID=890382 RepID=F0WMX5_9STRA|nr:AlNc14C163G7811 [Albugo laibachii Nc14]|eukprot:CCA22661.1 AlNc14C163G7811 [Albugo laibachii Nc14]
MQLVLVLDRARMMSGPKPFLYYFAPKHPIVYTLCDRLMSIIGTFRRMCAINLHKPRISCHSQSHRMLEDPKGYRCYYNKKSNLRYLRVLLDSHSLFRTLKSKHYLCP